VHQSVVAPLKSTQTKFDWLAPESQGMVVGFLCFEVRLIYLGVAARVHGLRGHAQPTRPRLVWSACIFFCSYTLRFPSLLQRRNAHCVMAECMLTSCRRAPCCYARVSECGVRFRCLHNLKFRFMKFSFVWGCCVAGSSPTPTPPANIHRHPDHPSLHMKLVTDAIGKGMCCIE